MILTTSMKLEICLQQVLQSQASTGTGTAGAVTFCHDQNGTMILL
jgi:hypothetical protein